MLPNPDSLGSPRTMSVGGGGSFLVAGWILASPLATDDRPWLFLEGSGGRVSAALLPFVWTLLPEGRRGGSPGRESLDVREDAGRDGGWVDCLLGGRGGRLASSNGGARKRPESTEVADVPIDDARLALVVVDRERSEAVDSTEFLRDGSWDGRRGGRAGGGWFEFLREGNGGGTLGLWPVDPGVGGGRAFPLTGEYSTAL